jgi:hypothetical protein
VGATLYDHSTNKLEFWTGSGPRMYVDSSGSVGINTIAPAEKLDVWGTIRASAGTNQYMHLYPVAGAGYFDVSNATTYPSIIFRQTGSSGTQERLRIDSSGNVGIGTDTISDNLEVFAPTNASLQIKGGAAGSDANRSAQLKLLASGSKLYTMESDATDGSFRILDSSTERLRITSGGNLGIKNTSPNNTLTVGDTVQPSYAPSSAGNYIEIARTSGADAGLLINKNTGQWLIGIDNSDGANSPLRFEYAAAGSAHPGFGSVNPAMIIKHDGKIGIGTDNPARRVEIFDTAATVLQLNSTNSGGTSLRIQNSGTDKMYMGLAGDFIVGQGNNVTDSAIRASGSLLFATGGGTERLRLDTAGRLSITGQGLKLSANASTLYTLDGSLSYYATNNAVYLNGAGTGGWLRLNASGAENNHNAINIFGDSAGAYITMHTNDGERLRITSHGNMGLGCNPGNSSGYRTLQIGDGSTTGGQIWLKNANNSNFYIWNANGGSGTNFYNQSSIPLIFYTNSLERLRIDGDGRLILGHNANINNFAQQIVTSNGAALGLLNYQNSDDGPEVTFQKSRNATKGTNTLVSNNDYLGRIFFRGGDGSGYDRGVEIAARVDGSSGTNAMPGRLEVYTTPAGQTTPTVKLTIKSNGSTVFTGQNAPSGRDTRISQYGSLLVATTGELISNARCSIDSGNGNIITEGSVQATGVNLQNSSTNSWFQTGASYGGTPYVWAAKDSSANVWHSGLQTDGDLLIGGNITGTSRIGLYGSSGNIGLTNATTSAKLNVSTDISGNYTGWKERNVASGSMSATSIASKTPTINDFTYPNSSNGMLIWSTSKIGFAAGSDGI